MLHKIFIFFIFLFTVSFVPGKKYAAVEQGLADRFFSFAKTYGYIKYFYPGDAAAGIDWDRFAFYGVRRLGESTTSPFSNELSNLFRPLAPEIRFHVAGEKIIQYLMPDPHHGKPVYWQHLGDGKGSIGYPYKSMRVNRPARVLPESSNDYSNIRMSLPAEDLLGNTIRLSGEFKVDPFFTGTASLIIAVKEKGKGKIEYSTEGQAVSSIHWTRHSIEMTVPPETEQLTIFVQGVITSGGMKVDNLLLEMKQGTEWKVHGSYPFDRETTEEFTDHWKPFAPNHEIELCPEGEGKGVLFQRSKGKIQNVSPLFAAAPATHEWLQKSIGSGLYVSFPLVLYLPDSLPVLNRDPGYHHLIQELESVAAEELAATNLYCRIANIIILWNKLQHFHPNLPLDVSQWENHLKKAILRSFTDKTIEEHRQTLMLLLEPAADSHMTIYYASRIKEEFFPPLRWEVAEKKLVITDVLDTLLPLRRGDVVTYVNGQDAVRYMEDLQRFVIGATRSRKEYKLVDESLKGASGSVLRFSVGSGPSVRNISVPRKLTEFEFNRLLQLNKTNHSFQSIGNELYYVNPALITWSDLQQHIPAMAASKGIIFDLRGYPKWKTDSVICHFIQEPVQKMTYLLPKVIYPDREKISFQENEPGILTPKLPLIKVPTIFLTNGKAISYAEDFLNLVQYYKLATIVGTPTAGTTGTVNMCFLFGGVLTPWTGMKVRRQDGVPFNGKGIDPDITVASTIHGIRSGIDEQLVFAIDYLKTIPNKP